MAKSKFKKPYLVAERFLSECTEYRLGGYLSFKINKLYDIDPRYYFRLDDLSKTEEELEVKVTIYDKLGEDLKYNIFPVVTSFRLFVKLNWTAQQLLDKIVSKANLLIKTFNDGYLPESL